MTRTDLTYETEAESSLVSVMVEDQEGGDGTEGDDEYIPDENEDYSDDELENDELVDDDEYIEARRRLRDRYERGL